MPSPGQTVRWHAVLYLNFVCLSLHRLHKRGVQSVVLYGSETWTMRKVDSDRIQSFHMQVLHRILGIRWYDKVSNAVVLLSSYIVSLPLNLIRTRSSWFGDYNSAAVYWIITFILDILKGI